MTIDDAFRVRDVRDLDARPKANGLRTLSATDTKEDKHNSHVWMVSYDGGHDLQFSYSQDSESSPRWSPDGKYLTFLRRVPEKPRAIKFGSWTAWAAKLCS